MLLYLARFKIITTTVLVTRGLLMAISFVREENLFL